MTSIFKYPLDLEGRQIVLLPEGAKILHANMQQGKPYLWAIVDTDKEDESRAIRIYGTGHQIQQPEKLVFINTILDHQFVWHVFESIK